MNMISIMTESTRNLGEGIKKSAESVFGGAGMEDSVGMMFKCAVTVAAGYTLWKFLTPDLFKWETKITVKRGSATKTYTAQAGVDTDSETHSENEDFLRLDKDKPKKVQNQEDSIENVGKAEE